MSARAASVAVACVAADGSSALIAVRVGPQSSDREALFAAAKARAVAMGYSGPFVCFDESGFTALRSSANRLRARRKHPVVGAPLFKTVMTLWSEDDPADVSLEDGLADQLDAAFDGTTHLTCSTKRVSRPHLDPDWDGTAAFDHLSDQ